MKEFNEFRYIVGYDNGGDPLIGYSEGMVDRKQKIQMLEHKLKLAVQDLKALTLDSEMFKTAINEYHKVIPAQLKEIEERDKRIRELESIIEDDGESTIGWDSRLGN